MAWLSAHIFYHSPPERLLLDCVGPLIERCKGEHGARRAFFLRYWKGGPHIRLRIEAEPGLLETHIAPLAMEEVQRYLAENPARNQIPEEHLAERHRHLSRLEIEPEALPVFYPNNSIQLISYEPELEKYGGPAGVDIAETLFDCSSAVVLKALRSCHDKPQVRLGIGFSLLLIALKAFELSWNEMQALVSRYTLRWEKYLPKALANVEEPWRQQYQLHRPQLLKIAMAVFHDRFHQDPVLSAWWHGVRHAYAELMRLFEQGDASQRAGRLALLLCNYIHTTNNRLGLETGQESYLSFLAQLMLNEDVLRDSLAGRVTGENA